MCLCKSLDVADLCLRQRLETDIESKAAEFASLATLCQLVSSEQASCRLTADVSGLQRTVDEINTEWDSLRDRAAQRRQLYVAHSLLNAAVMPNMSHCQITRSTRFAQHVGIIKPKPNSTTTPNPKILTLNRNRNRNRRNKY